ncbi:Hypothetical Protein SiL_2115 [Sulfolobus islandicus LAL14/1]|uniref:Uncharacterized protein n=1 Tax=Saccharolobus islandicus LAL14/1 TaxID=1241935 RepID=M9UBS9_SACIS|nr:Hypothetical Protein SiL_2115 [Sulfolobus islandicus LAL14/1]
MVGKVILFLLTSSKVIFRKSALEVWITIIGFPSKTIKLMNIFFILLVLTNIPLQNSDKINTINMIVNTLDARFSLTFKHYFSHIYISNFRGTDIS